MRKSYVTKFLSLMHGGSQSWFFRPGDERLKTRPENKQQSRGICPLPTESLILNFIKVIVKKKSPWQNLIASLRNRGKETRAESNFSVLIGTRSLELLQGRGDTQRPPRWPREHLQGKLLAGSPAVTAVPQGVSHTADTLPFSSRLASPRPLLSQVPTFAFLKRMYVYA